MKVRRSPNIASALTRMAEKMPDSPAIHYPIGRNGAGKQQYVSMTYGELDDESTLIAQGLIVSGMGKGTYAALMVKPSMEFFALTFALFKAGVIPVLIDPGIGLKSLKACLGEAGPTAFIGIPAAHAARVVLGWGRGTLKNHVTVGRRWFWGGATLGQVREAGRGQPQTPLPGVEEDDVAAILFTSGSTGVPKGAVYTHGTFSAQVEYIQRTYDIQPGEIDLPTFPLFALFDPALGMTTVIPEMDAQKPALVDPRNVIEPILEFGVTNMFGSPALLNRVGRAGVEQGVKLPTLKRVISAGAPVPAPVLERIVAMVNDGVHVHTPYGATESLPVASVSSEEILGETAALTDKGKGVCVGKPIEGARVEVIHISDEPIESWSEDLRVEAGEIGEFVVQGRQVSKRYHNRDESTKLAKIDDPVGGVMHRMGDVGYIDEQGRLWFCGRKSHRVIIGEETLYTIPCEGIFNAHPAVFRTALVGVERAGEVRPVLCVEREKFDFSGGSRPQLMSNEEIRAELLELGAAHAHTAGIKDILFHEAFPVDIRHNSKIFREKLKVWAEKELR
ncbi:MAG: fatty acid CoA ligase family protein [Bradymonadaceae bacterium]